MSVTPGSALFLLYWPTLLCALLPSPSARVWQNPQQTLQQPATFLDSLRSLDRAGRDAREAGEWEAALRHATRMDAMLGGYPSTKLVMARASLKLGDTTGALRSVRTIADMGMFVDVNTDTTLSGVLRRDPAIVERFKDNKAKVGHVSTVAIMRENNFIAEGITHDPVGQRTFVSSILYGKVIEISASGAIREFADLTHDGGWSGLGLAVDSKRNRLWVTTAWYPHGGRFAKADSGLSAVFQYDMQSGVLQRRFSIPRGTHEPGDVCVAPNGDVFVSDGREGTIRVIREGADSLSLFVKTGSFFSPQGCAVDAQSSQLFVADYVVGMMSVNLKSGLVHRLPKPPNTAVAQIDGLVMQGDFLLGVQNGTVPNRVLAMQLNREHTALTAVRIIACDTAVVTDATHLTVAGRDVLFVENSGFNRYDATGQLRTGVVEAAPRIGRVSFRQDSKLRGEKQRGSIQ